MTKIYSLDELNKQQKGRNLLINGDFSVNQRGFDGNWAGATEGNYGFDRWKKSGTNIIQIVEEGGYKSNSIHTLSENGNVVSELTSPSSGNWTITIANTATNIQLELGPNATDFEIIPVADQIARCQRYFWRWEAKLAGYPVICLIHAFSDSNALGVLSYPVKMHKVPEMSHSGISTFRLLGGGVLSSNDADLLMYASGQTETEASIYLSGGTFTSNTVYNFQGSSPSAYMDFNAEIS